MTPAERLLAIAQEQARWFTIDELSYPDFSEDSRYTGWAYYVPLQLQAAWDGLSTEARLVAAIAALNRRDADNAMTL